MIEKDIGSGLRTREYPDKFVVQGTTVQGVDALTFLRQKGVDAIYVRFGIKKSDWPHYRFTQLSDGKVISIEFTK